MLIIDAVDELPNTGGKSLVDLIPDAAQLSDGIFLLITCRPPVQTSDYTKHILTALTFDEKISVDEADDDYLGVLKKFVAEKTSADTATVEKILHATDNRLINLKNVVNAYVRIGDRCFENLAGNVFEILRTLYGERYYAEIFHFATILAALSVPVTVKELAELAGEEVVTFKLMTYLGELKPILNISRHVDGTLISVTRPEIRKFLRGDEKVFKKIYGTWNEDLQATDSIDDDKIFLLKYLGLCSAEENFRNDFAQKPAFVKISKAVVPRLTYQSERDYLFATELLKVLCRDVAPVQFGNQLEATIFVLKELAEIANTYGGNISEIVDNLKQVFKLIRDFDLPTQFDFATMLGTMLAKTNHGAEAENYFALANEFLKKIDATLTQRKSPQTNRDGIANTISLIKNLTEQAVKDKDLSNYNKAAQNLNRARELIDGLEKYFGGTTSGYLLSLRIAVLKTFGNIYKRQEPEKALKYFSEIRQILDGLEFDDAQLHGAKYDLLLNMGQAYRALKDYDKAAQLYDEGIALIEAMKIRGELFEAEYLVSLYNSRANVERDLENHAAAIKFYTKALEIADAERRAGKFINPNMYASIKASLATAHEKSGDRTTANHLRGTVNTSEINKSHLLHSAPAHEKIFFRNASDDADDELYERGMDLIYEVNVPHREKDGMKILTEAANAGNVKAMNILGVFYQRGGTFVKRNLTESAKWFSKAAEHGHVYAITELAGMYLEGNSVEKNIDKAIKLFSEAANMGDAQAMFLLGQLYHFGDKIPRDGGKALEWYERAAAAGNENAMTYLGAMYADGLGVTKYLDRSFDWLQKSLALGNVIALLKLMEITGEREYFRKKFRESVDLFMDVLTTYMGNPIMDEIIEAALVSLSSVYMTFDFDSKKFDRLFRLLKQAADWYYPKAIFLLGLMYGRGDGVPKNAVKGSALMTKGLTLGSTEVQYVPPTRRH